jgi:hypothetical protein
MAPIPFAGDYSHNVLIAYGYDDDGTLLQITALVHRRHVEGEISEVAQ